MSLLSKLGCLSFPAHNQAVSCPIPILAINETILMVRTTKDLSLSFVCLGNVTTDLGRVDAEAGCCARVYLCVAVERVWWVLQV